LCHSVILVMGVTLVTYVTFVSNIIVMCHWSPNVSQESSYNCRVRQTALLSAEGKKNPVLCTARVYLP
jgi:hypothetical protein